MSLLNKNKFSLYALAMHLVGASSWPLMFSELQVCSSMLHCGGKTCWASGFSAVLFCFPISFKPQTDTLHSAKHNFNSAKHEYWLMQCLHAKHLSHCFELEHQQAWWWQDIISIQYSRTRNGEANDQNRAAARLPQTRKQVGNVHSVTSHYGKDWILFFDRWAMCLKYCKLPDVPSRKWDLQIKSS